MNMYMSSYIPLYNHMTYIYIYMCIHIYIYIYMFGLPAIAWTYKTIAFRLLVFPRCA